MLNKSDDFYCIYEKEVSHTLKKCFRKPQALVHLETPSCFKPGSAAKWCMKSVAILVSVAFAYCSSASKRKLQLSSL